MSILVWLQDLMKNTHCIYDSVHLRELQSDNLGVDKHKWVYSGLLLTFIL